MEGVKRAACAAAAVVVLSVSALAFDWISYVVDPTPGAGVENAMASDGHGFMHVSYLDVNSRTLRHISNESGTWLSTVVDDTEETGFANSIAVDEDGGVHISYRTREGRLRYAYREPGQGAWQIEKVHDGEPLVFTYSTLYMRLWNSSLGLVRVAGERGRRYGYQPVICFPDNIGEHARHLKMAVKTNGHWRVATVDAIGEQVGGHCALAVDDRNDLHIAYQNIPAADGAGFLRYAHFDRASAAWAFAVIEDAPNAWPSAVSLALDGGAVPHVVYSKWGRVSYANNATGTWKTQTLLPGGQPTTTSIRVDSNGVKHVCFNFDVPYKALGYITFSPDAPGEADIFSQIVDDFGQYHYCSLALDTARRPWIAHHSIQGEEGDNGLKISQILEVPK